MTWSHNKKTTTQKKRKERGIRKRRKNTHNIYEIKIIIN